jgi:two-component system, OmpR family, alkaline phosphatase synthesis response regulator PhoP
MSHRLLIIEDEPAMAMGLSDLFTSEGYQVAIEHDGEAGLARALAGPFDLIVLDVMLPGKNGIEVCRSLRAQARREPILMLTARGEPLDKVLGLKLGADDYLSKPFESLELLARVEALLRRSSAARAEGPRVFVCGPLRVDLSTTEITCGGQRVELSAREFQLLRYLIQHRGETLSREKLLTEVWGFGDGALSRTVDIHMARLRKKLERDARRPQLIVTVQGLGYKLVG